MVCRPVIGHRLFESEIRALRAYCYLALGLGIILILLSLLINALVYLSQDFAQRFAD